GREYEQEDADLHLLRVLPCLSQHAVLACPVTEQDPAWRRSAGGDPVIENELPIRHARRSRDEVGHRANARKEARQHDELRSVPLEEADDALDLLARNVPADSRLQQRLAVRRARAADNRVADEDPRQT